MTEFRLSVLRHYEDGAWHSTGEGPERVAVRWLHLRGYLAEHGTERGYFKVTWLGRQALSRLAATT